MHSPPAQCHLPLPDNKPTVQLEEGGEGVSIGVGKDSLHMDLKLAAGFFVMEVEHREDKNLFETFDWWVRSGVTGCETEKEFEDLMKSRGNSSDMTR